MVFLMQQELEEEGVELDWTDRYRFKAYDYGPFSKELYDDIDALVEEQIVEEDEEELEEDKVRYEYRIKKGETEFLKQHFSEEEARKIVNKAEEIKAQFNHMPLPQVIDKVYSQYPAYAENSIY